MHQVGEEVTLIASPTPSGSVIYSYVWDFWDGTSTASVAPFVTKVINIGGQPGTDELNFTCQPVAVDGQSIVLAGSLSANNPPTILPGVSITNNDDYFAFNTQLSLQAIDLDGDSFYFAWYSGTTYLGTGTTVAAGTVAGTWTGNGTTLIQDYPSSQNYIDVTVAESGVATCYVVDDRSGTSSVNFLLRGTDNPNPTAVITAGIEGISFDSATPPTARVGSNQFVDFTVFVAPLPSHLVTFQWSFAGTNNWSMLPAYEAGTRYDLSNGGIQNTVHRDISTEVISTGTSKVATADVQITASNIFNGQVTRTDAEYTITLIKNTAPSGVTVTRKVNGVEIDGLGPVTAGDLIEFSASGSDINEDVLFYEWKFIQPFDPINLYLWGPKVLFSTSGFGTGSTVDGQLTTRDWLDASLVTVLPTTNVE